MAAADVARSGGHKILLMASGSRGDIQPIIALGLALQRAGFAVRVFTNSNHAPFARAMGLEAVGGNLDSEELLRDNPLAREGMAKGNMMKFMELVGDMNRERFPGVLAQKLEVLRAWRPDLILSTPLEFFESSALAGAEGVPLVWAGLQLQFPSREQKTMLREPGCFPHRIMGTLMIYFWWKGEHDAKAAAIREQLPAAEPFLAASLREFMYLVHHPTAPTLIGFSPSLKRVPSDYPEDLKARLSMTGFWTVGSEEQERRFKDGDAMFGGEERAALEAFLARGAPPVYMGWGSMIAVSAEYMTCLAVGALLRAGMRGVVLQGYAGLGPQLLAGQPDTEHLAAYAADNVLFVKTAPHEWLFPQCCAVVHHGGAGTTAAALRSGAPTVITPIVFDQFDQAALVADSGAGIRTKHISKLTARALAAALRRCAEDKDLQQRAGALAGKLRGEEGLGGAVRAIDAFLTDEVKTGRWRASFEAQRRGLESLRSRPPPSCLAWCARLCCSAAPNDYSVRPAAAGRA